MLQKSVYLFYVDRPVNIAWYQEAAFAFASANVARFHPYGEITEMFEKRRQEAKQKAFRRLFAKCKHACLYLA